MHIARRILLVVTVVCATLPWGSRPTHQAALAQTPASYKPLLSANELLGAIRYKALQAELKFTREQVQQAKTLESVVSQKHREFDQQRGKFLARTNDQVAGDYEREILGMLTDDQRPRFQQVCRQVKAAEYLGSAEAQQELMLTPEQSEAVLQALNGPVTLSLANRKEKIESTLDDEQLAKWDELIGPPFKSLRGLINSVKPKKSPASRPATGESREDDPFD